MSEDYDADYAHHIVVRLEDHRILLKRPGHSEYWTEFVAGSMGTLLIHGDGPDIVFRLWHREHTIESMIRWVARQTSPSYLASKILLGIKEEYDPVLAKQELREYIEDLDADDDSKGSLQDIFDEESYWWPEEQHDLQKALLEVDPDLWEMHFGWKPPEALESLQAACRRCLACLEHLPRDDQFPDPDMVETWEHTQRRGVFSHDTSLYYHQLSDVLPNGWHLTLPQDFELEGDFPYPHLTRVSRAMIPKKDIVWFKGIPMTSPERTLQDYGADGGNPEHLEVASRQARDRGWLPPAKARTEET